MANDDAVQVLLIGEPPLTDELAGLCRNAGLQASLHRSGAAAAPETIAAKAQAASFALDVICADVDAKQDLVRLLDNSLPADALLLTACLPVTATQAAAWTAHRGRVVGFGALPPLAKNSLVELALPLQGQDGALARPRAFFDRLGLQTAVVRDTPGLVLPRVVCCLVNEAAYAITERVAEPSDIDTAMKLGANYPRGPLEWADIIGLDVVLGVLTGLHQETGDDHFRPAPLLKQLVRAGRLGKRTGQGFYTY